MTKLDLLNNLLDRDAAKLNLPQFRAKVSSSGANQDWLKKALKRHSDVDPKIVELLALPFKTLLTEHVE